MQGIKSIDVTHLPRHDILVSCHQPTPGLQHSSAELSAKAHGSAGDDEVGVHFVIWSQITNPVI